jgi:double-stranded uracil-DNA glycosylase
VPTGLPPVVDGGTRVLVLGSMPGDMSLRMHQYYAHPRNAFWRIMTELVGLDSDYPSRLEGLLSAGIGLWDVLHICERSGSLDSAIVRESMKVNDFGKLFAEHPAISRVFFNGARAEQVFQRQVVPSLGYPVFSTRLPSTSPANAVMPYVTKLRSWRAVLDVG